MRRILFDRRGSAIIEMTLVGIPMIFILISTFEVARGMWAYNTLAHAVRETSRYVTVHGNDCSVSPNSCAITVGTVATYFAQKAVGLPSNQVAVTFGSYSCNPLSTCFSNSNAFPPSGSNTAPDPVTVTGVYPFKSAIAMFWPGSSPVSFATVNLYATSTDYIQF